MTHPFTSVLVLAAGGGQRMGCDKIFFLLGEKSVIRRTLEALQAAETVDEIVVVTSDAEKMRSESCGLSKVTAIVAGGETRLASARNGFAAVSGKTAFVSIHDGARPFVRPEEVDAVHRRAYETGAAICGTYAVDTVKVVDASGRILSSPDRRMLFCAATPQVFSRNLYARALAQAQREDAEYTDDSACVAAVGAEIYTECCSHSNFKLTTPQDLLRAKAWLDAEKDNIPELC